MRGSAFGRVHCVGGNIGLLWTRFFCTRAGGFGIMGSSDTAKWDGTMKQYVIGIDFGTLSARAALFDVVSGIKPFGFSRFSHSLKSGSRLPFYPRCFLTGNPARRCAVTSDQASHRSLPRIRESSFTPLVFLFTRNHEYRVIGINVRSLLRDYGGLSQFGRSFTFSDRIVQRKKASSRISGM